VTERKCQEAEGKRRRTIVLERGKGRVKGHTENIYIDMKDKDNYETGCELRK
jgi:hypothetical protein